MSDFFREDKGRIGRQYQGGKSRLRTRGSSSLRRASIAKGKFRAEFRVEGLEFRV